MKKYLLHRQIDFFDKHSEKLMGEIDLKYFDLEKIKTKIDFDINDPLLYNAYPIDSDISDIFPEIEFDFTQFDYFLSCFSDYSIRTNNTMDNYLMKIEYDYGNSSIELTEKIQSITKGDWITDNQCVTINGQGNKNNPVFETDFEKCEWEYNENHIHIDSFVEYENELDYLKVGLEYAKRLAIRLSNQFKNDRFRIIVSFSETIKTNDEIDTFGSCTVRFYKIRQSCETKMNVENLNDYKTDAILEFEKR